MPGRGRCGKGDSMGRRRKYTPKKMQTEINRYFSSISRTVTAKEAVDLGKRDDKGHVVWDYIEIKNDAGELIRHTEYVIPPTVSGLCRYLKIHRSTWSVYRADPEYAAVTERAVLRIREYLEEQLLSRTNVRGIMFELQNNYGYSDKKEIELGPGAQQAVSREPMSHRLELLREIAREFAAGDNAGADSNTDAG